MNGDAEPHATASSARSLSELAAVLEDATLDADGRGLVCVCPKHGAHCRAKIRTFGRNWSCHCETKADEVQEADFLPRKAPEPEKPPPGASQNGNGEPVATQTAPLPQRGISLDELAGCFEGVRWRGDRQFQFKCPSHDDKQASGSAKVGDKGILLRCFAGCRIEQIVSAVGLTMSDLFFAPGDRVARQSVQRHQVRYSVKTQDGITLAIHGRENTPDGKRMWWELPDGRSGLGGTRTEDLPLYGLDKLGQGTEVIICEGEKDAQALIDRGLPGLGTVTGASSCPSEASLKALIGRRAVLWPDNDPAGEQHMRKVALALTRLAIPYRVLNWPEAPKKGGAADFAGSTDEIAALIAAATALPAVQGAALPAAVTALEPPRPLKRDVGRAEPYPHQSLGPILAPVAEAVQAATQAPMAISAQSVLATANFCVQAHINVELPTGDVRPVSEFLLTVAESGERKTAADERALQGVRAREQALAEVSREEWRFYKNDLEAFEKQRAQVLANTKNADRTTKREALAALGDEPKLPRGSILLCGDPTFEGLARLLREGYGHCGIFSSEGGMFVGGHGMSNEAKLRTITGPSAIWDGLPVKRTRGGDGNHSLPGRRVAMHLLVQPTVADLFFGDALLVEQGLLSRVLASAPDAIAGSRPFRKLDTEHFSQISNFRREVTRILEPPVPCNEKDSRELQPRTVKLSLDATRLWIGFHDHIEKLITPDAPLSPVKPLANKAPEHAARLAATIEAFPDLQVETISAQAMQWGIDLAQHYLAEALRIYGAIQDSPDLRVAEKALRWIRAQPGGVFSVPDLYQIGPHSIRDAATARSIVAILVEHHWVTPIEGGAVVNGVRRREAFALTEEAKK